MMKRAASVFLFIACMFVLVGIRPADQVATLQLADSAALGISGGIYSVHKFGYNDLATGDVEESVWDIDDIAGAGTGPIRCWANSTSSTGDILYVSSDDATDAAKTVTIEVLDANYVMSTPTITLGADTGATGTEFVAISSATKYLRVNRAYAAASALAGNIYIHTDSTDAAAKDGIPDDPENELIAGITAGENQTLQACYTVPAGYNALLMTWCKSNLKNSGVATAATFRWRKSVEEAASRNQTMIVLGDSITQCAEIRPSALFTEKTDIEITAQTTTQSVSGDFGLLLVPNTMK